MRPYRLHPPSGRARSYATGRAASVGAARLATSLYDGRTGTSPWMRLDGPDGTVWLRAEGLGMVCRTRPPEVQEAAA